ncbi:unnamed protein product [Ilex paraguariensis]|uniref:Uncharacterized protein n=1 Tax=Ilex paraguariensis TaxID=185542 RepID=A0ABC8SE89_9AQUA
MALLPVDSPPTPSKIKGKGKLSKIEFSGGEKQRDSGHLYNGVKLGGGYSLRDHWEALVEKESSKKEFLCLVEKMLKLQKNLVKKVAKENEAFSLKVFELFSTLKRKHFKLFDALEKKEFELIKAVKIATYSAIKEFNDSFAFKKGMLGNYDSGFKYFRDRAIRAFPELDFSKIYLRMIHPRSSRRNETNKKRPVMRRPARLL